ncbi:MAG: porin [Hyphomicrobiaceae bacterium]
MSTSFAAALLAACFATSSAQAADFGGDCCADLEERIAELEATTVRKGNRKVSLRISGWVAEQIAYWDDGSEDNVYVQGMGEGIATHFKLTGTARISPDWSAGYVLQIEAQSSDPLLNLDQDNDDGGAGLSIYQSKWFLRSQTLGQVSVGLLSQASDNAALLVDSSGSILQGNWIMYDGAGYFANSNGARLALPNGNTVRYGDVAYCHSIGFGTGGDCHGLTTNGVRYDTPVWGGFSASAGWGEDDYWDVAARFTGEGLGFRLAVAAAYSQNTDNNDRPNITAGGGLDSSFTQVGGYLQHLQTGLFLYGAYGREDNNFNYLLPNAGLIAAPDNEQYYVKGGIRARVMPVGHSILFGEFGQSYDQVSDNLLDAGISSSELTRWGVGLVQEIDNASMSVWLKYRNIEGDFSGAGGTTELDDIDFIVFGGLIAF